MPDIHARCREEGECKGPQVRSCLTGSKEIQEAGRSRKNKRRTDSDMGKNREQDHIVCGKNTGKRAGHYWRVAGNPSAEECLNIHWI